MTRTPRWLLTFPEDRPSVPVYSDWVSRAGVVPEIIQAGDPLPADPGAYEALLLPGGGDVEPALYGASARHPRTYDVDPAQDEREVRLIHAFLAAGRPVFGICRGLQIINVAFGGELIQHLPDVLPEERERHRKAGAYDAMHPLACELTTRLGWRLQKADQTNSAHHQAIDPDALGRGLVVAARSGGGIIEAVESSGGPVPVVAVQWHPERLPADHPASAGVLDYFRSLAAVR